MKKTLSIVLCAAFILGTAACQAAPVETTTEATTTEATTVTTTEATEDTTTTETSETTTEDTRPKGDVVFSTKDRDGNQYTDEIFADHKLTMINFWEPWCGPCVSEIPELEKLYENYKDKGFLILGVYSEPEMERNVDEILKDGNVQYPILWYCQGFDKFLTGYVPTTVFVDSNGKIVDLGISNADNGPYMIGANSYEDWEAMIKPYLEK